MNKRISLLAILALAAVLVLGWVAQNTGYNSNHFDTSSVGNIAIKSSALLTNTMFQDSGTGPSVLVSDQIGLSSVQKIFEVDDSMSTPKLYVTGDGHVHSDGSFSALTPSFSGAVTVNSVSYTASRVLGTDGSKVIVSYSAGAGINTDSATIRVQYATNASDSVLMPVGIYSVLVTNNTVTLANNFLSGANYSASAINEAVLLITNTTATAKTLITPASVICPGALGTQTFFITNLGVFSVTSWGNSVTAGVFRSFP